MPRVYELPTHLQVEDVLIAGLTARQLVRLMVGASLTYGLWDQTAAIPMLVRLSATVVLAVAGLLLALIRPAGRPLDQWLLAALLFAVSPHKQLWRRTPAEFLCLRSTRLRGGPNWRRVPIGLIPATRNQRRPSPSLDHNFHHVEVAAMNASVQARLELLALEGGIARFGAAQPGHAVSVLDVVGSDTSMSTADDATQEELLAGRAQFLNAQTTAFQVLVRAEPVDLDGHLRRVQAQAELLAEPLASVARDYVTFVQTLAFQRTLLERHCYVVLPDQTEPPVVR
jgi:PrgI family protein